MKKTVRLDASELEPPEPYRLAIETLAELPPNTVFEMTHRREPFPLYQTAHEMGFEYSVSYVDDDRVIIRFWYDAS